MFSIEDTAESKLGRKKRKPFISDEVIQLAKEKTKARRNGNYGDY